MEYAEQLDHCRSDLCGFDYHVEPATLAHVLRLLKRGGTRDVVRRLVLIEHGVQDDSRASEADACRLPCDATRHGSEQQRRRSTSCNEVTKEKDYHQAPALGASVGTSTQHMR